MRRRNREAYLWDILDAGEAIVDFVAGRDLAGFLANRMLHRAVERELSVIGEAINQMTRAFPETATIAGPVGQIVAFRNILIHEYADVSQEIVWGVVQGQVPALVERVRAALESGVDPAS